MSAPRQASGPRRGSGPRAPGAARSRVDASRAGGRTTRPAHAAHDAPTAVATAPAQKPDVTAEAEPRAADELSNWQLLLQQLDALLRDPTLTRALAASLANLAAGVRGLSAATRDAVRRLVQALRRLRLPFPRRVLLGLLALLLPLALLALLSPSDEDGATRGARDQPAPAAPAGAAGAPSLPGVGMPDLLPAPAKVPRVRVALVVDRTYDATSLRRELRALGSWLAVNHAPGTRVSVIDAQSARASRPLRAGDLADVRLQRQRRSTRAAIRSALVGRKGRRLLVALGTAAPRSTARTLRIATRRGAGAGAGAGSSLPLRRGRRSRVTIDDRRPNALAASVARAIMAVSGQREQR